MDPFSITTIATALLPAAADAIRGAVGWFTGGAGAKPQNVSEAIQLSDAETRRFQALQAADGTQESYKWVAAIRQLQRPFIAAIVTVAWCVVQLGEYDDFARDTVTIAASHVWFYLFGERAYLGLRGAKK